MNIEEAKKKVENLEVAINNLIWNFEKDTGLEITSIDLRRINHVGNGRVLKSDVITDVSTTLPKKAK